MRTHRTIFRLDYPFNDKICDAPGKVIRKIMDLGGERYSEVQDAPLKRVSVVQGSADDGAIRWTFQISPLMTVVTMEWSEGLTLDGITSSADFQSVLELIDEMRHSFGIDQLHRSGLRNFIFYSVDNPHLLQTFVSRVDAGINEAIETTLGSTNDFGMTYEGKNEDGIFFRIQMGPYVFSQQENSKYFELIRPSSTFEAYNLICDIDVSQKQFHSRGHTSSAWIRSLLPKIDNFGQSLVANLGQTS